MSDTDPPNDEIRVRWTDPVLVCVVAILTFLLGEFLYSLPEGESIVFEKDYPWLLNRLVHWGLLAAFPVAFIAAFKCKGRLRAAVALSVTAVLMPFWYWWVVPHMSLFGIAISTHYSPDGSTTRDWSAYQLGFNISILVPVVLPFFSLVAPAKWGPRVFLVNLGLAAGLFMWLSYYALRQMGI